MFLSDVPLGTIIHNIEMAPGKGGAIARSAGAYAQLNARDGKYAKVEILSYYENATENPDAFVDATPYYTFNYVYQPNTATLWNGTSVKHKHQHSSSLVMYKRGNTDPRI